MSAPPGRDGLSHKLRELRAAAGMTAVQVAGRTGFSKAKISRFERGTFVPSVEDAEAYARAVDASTEDREFLVALASDIRESSETRLVLLRAGSGGAARVQQRIQRAEMQSAHVGTFANTLVPGLTQTQNYARAVFQSADLTDADVESGVASRAARQVEALHSTERQYTQIVTYGALTWCAGSAQLMANQCEHLAELATASTASRFRVGVIPMARSVRQFPLEAFDLYDQRAVLLGTYTATAWMTKPADVDAYARLFKELESAATFGAAAAAVFRDLAQRYATQPEP